MMTLDLQQDHTCYHKNCIHLASICPLIMFEVSINGSQCLRWFCGSNYIHMTSEG